MKSPLIELLLMSTIKATFLSILSAQILKIVKKVFWGHFLGVFLEANLFLALIVNRAENDPDQGRK